MKTVLEVLQNGDGEIRFNTDFDFQKKPAELINIMAGAAIAMTTTLWSGNEVSVIAAIRALSVADLSVCVNRKDMVKHLDEESANLANSLQQAKKHFEEMGHTIAVFPPGVVPGKTRS